MLKRSIIYFLFRAMNGVLGVGSIAILSRLLSAQEYGQYAVGIAAILFASSIAFQWLNVSVGRFAAAHQSSIDQFLGQSRKLFNIIGLILVIGGLIYGLVIGGKGDPSKLVFPPLIAAGAVSIGLHNFYLQVANARLEPTRYGLLTVSRSALSLFISVLLINLGCGPVGALVGFSVGTSVSALIFSTKTKATNERTPDIRRNLLAYGIPLSVGYISIAMLDFSGRFFLSHWSGAPSVASYAAAYDLTQQSIGVAMNIFYLAAFPSVTTAWEGGNKDVAASRIEVLKRVLMIVGPYICGVLIVLSGDIAKVFMGAEIREEAIQLMPIIAIAITVGCIKSYLFDVPLQLYRKTKAMMIAAIAMAAVNIALNALLIPMYGARGAAIATLAAFTAGALVSLISGRKLSTLKFKVNDILLSLLAPFLMVATCTFVVLDIFEPVLNGVIRFSIATTVYASLCLVCNHMKVRSMIVDSLKKRFRNKESSLFE